MSVDHYENFPVASLLVPAPDCASRSRSSTALRAAPTTLPTKAMRHRKNAWRRWPPTWLSWSTSSRHAAANTAVRRTGRSHRHPRPANPAIPRPARRLRAGCRQEALRRLPGTARLLPAFGQPGRPTGAASVWPHRSLIHLEQSDCICSALQLINFWQDVAIDWQKDRVYIPQTDLPAFQGQRGRHRATAAGRPTGRR
jgi:hypothetical protein